MGFRKTRFTFANHSPKSSCSSSLYRRLPQSLSPKDGIFPIPMAVKTLLIRPFTLSASRFILQSSKPSSILIKMNFLHTIRSSRAAIVSVVSKILTLETLSRDEYGFRCVRLIEGRGRSFNAGTTHVNDAGSIDSPLMQSMEKKIKEELNAEHVSVKDASGDDRHVSIDVISSSFEGKSAVNRQRMVYKAIWEELQNTVHAVDQMTTRTPSEDCQK